MYSVNFIGNSSICIEKEKAALDNKFKISKIGDSAILYDASIITDVTLQLFDHYYHTNNEEKKNNSLLDSTSGVGRARVVYFNHEGKSLVLKHYYRGGAVAYVTKDCYLGFDIEKTRAFREWRLLKKMQKLGLAVPEAIAAHVEKHLLFYRADLITREIENAETLADLLSKRAIDADTWKKIGACIKSFHQHDVYHSDLNARNILLVGSLPEADDVYLIDFDNSYFRVNEKSWKMANLTRLKRSLLKFKNNTYGFNFSEEDWSDLMDGYQ